MSRAQSPSPDPSDGGAGSLNRRAALSLVMGLVALAFSFVWSLGTFAFGLVAITTGIHARREIAASATAETGESLASAGVILGAGSIALLALSYGIGVVRG